VLAGARACWYAFAMGLTSVAGKVRRPDGRGRPIAVDFLVDSGALYSVLPEDVWRALRLRPARTAKFGLADGTVIQRRVSECRFEIGGQGAVSPAVLGERDDGPLLGAVTLETLGLMLNPLTRELAPMRVLPLMCVPTLGPA
jgi:predicted aspartyl protease